MNTRERQKAEYKRLLDCLKGLDANRRTAYDGLLHEAAFLAVTLEDLRQQISKEGVIEVYQNGPNQHGQKPSTTVATYDKLLHTYSKVMLQLSKGLPDADQGPFANLWQ